SLKLEGAAAEGDLTLKFTLMPLVDRFPADLPSASFEESASLTTNQDGAASFAGGSGAGKVKFADGWRAALTGPVTSVQIDNATGLTHDNTPLMRKAGGESFTLANTTAAPPAAAAPSLMLDETESF